MTTIDITGQLAAYMAQARDMRLARRTVAQEAKHRILDALAAIVSGSHLPLAINKPFECLSAVLLSPSSRPMPKGYVRCSAGLLFGKGKNRG
jgi:hypothetical protein